MTNPNKFGLVVGMLMAGWHVCWVILVAAGWAQRLLDFVFWAHMIQPVYVVRAFDPQAATTLILITFVIGYAFGWVGGFIWNRLHRQQTA